MFFKGSRYENVPEDVLATPSGGAIRYKRTRFIPPTPARLVHQLVQGERLDHLAFLAYRDPERSWRIADANFATWPPDLVTEVGARVLIPPASG
jgi:hypothetical protein